MTCCKVALSASSAVHRRCRRARDSRAGRCALLGAAAILLAPFAWADSEVAPDAASREGVAAAAPAEISDQEVIRRFLEIWSRNPFGVMGNSWYGISTLQNPVDAWVVQEIISQTRPDFVVETGTWHGGSALLWATVLENVNPAGRVITIDVENMSAEARKHPIARRRVDFLIGSSVDPRIVEEVTRRVGGHKVLVLLDSLHTREHVAKELAAYAPLVPVGGYVIVQDTGIGKEWPIAAVNDFIAGNDEFVIDPGRERLILTNSRRGYLKRVKPSSD